jgi:exosortase
MNVRFPFVERRPRSALALIASLLLLGLLWSYWPTLGTLARRWAHDPQYTHGYVVPIFALIVLWFRRDQLAWDRLAPSWWGVVFLLLGAGLRQVGAMLYVELLEGFSLLPSLVGVCLLLGGWAMLRWAWPALTFLLFILPLPYQVDVLSQPLRRLATVASTYALQTLGLPAIAEGNIIVVDDLRVGVIEACSGLGMLMTFFALSTAVAFVMNRPLSERVLIFVSAVPVGVLMNVMRITVTVFLLRFANAEVARFVFHEVAGWVMMPLALVVLWLEMRFLEKLWVSEKPTGPIPVVARSTPTFIIETSKPTLPAAR